MVLPFSAEIAKLKSIKPQGQATAPLNNRVMKIRVYPANMSFYTKVFAEIECDGIPREGEFFSVPFEIEQEWARIALSDKDHCTMLFQWISMKERSKAELCFADAMVVNDVSWLYDRTLQKMVCYVGLDADVKGKPNYSENDDGIDEKIDIELFSFIKANSSKYYGIKL